MLSAIKITLCTFFAVTMATPLVAQDGHRRLSPQENVRSFPERKTTIDNNSIIMRNFLSICDDDSEAIEIAPPEPYFEALGTVSGLELLPAEAKGVGGIDFCFRFKPDGQDRNWFVISRGSTPFEVYRLGPTYVRIDSKSLTDGTRVWLFGVKTVDRIPVTFHKKSLPANATVTAFLITQPPAKAGESGKPLYVNNWFHPWRNDESGKPLDGIIDRHPTRYFVDRKGPFWVCGWLPADTSNPDKAKRLAEVRSLLSDSDVKTISAESFKKGVYRGYLITDKSKPLGYRLKLTQFWRHVPQTGGYQLMIGKKTGLERLP